MPPDGSAKQIGLYCNLFQDKQGLKSLEKFIEAHHLNYLIRENKKNRVIALSRFMLETILEKLRLDDYGIWPPEKVFTELEKRNIGIIQKKERVKDGNTECSPLLIGYTDEESEDIFLNETMLMKTEEMTANDEKRIEAFIIGHEWFHILWSQYGDKACPVDIPNEGYAIIAEELAARIFSAGLFDFEISPFLLDFTE